MAKKLYQKKRGRRAYLDDFQVNEDGTWVYTGGRYVYQGTDFSSAKKRLGIYAGLMLISAIGAGCLPAPGLTTPLVLIPYALAAAFSVSSCLAFIRLCRGGNPMRTYAYNESVLLLPRRSLITAVSAGASLTGEILFVIQKGYWQGLLRAPGFFLCLIVTFISAVLFNRKAGSMTWTEEKKDSAGKSPQTGRHSRNHTGQ